MKVRIYKSPDGNGKYLNKTSQFLKKAQLGGVPAESEMGYPGSSSEKKEATQEELVELIANDLSNNIDEQTISYKLATFYDLEPMTALNLVSQVKDYIESQDTTDYNAYDEDEDEQTTDEEDAEEEDLLEAEAVLNGPGQDLDEASNDIANSESIATQDDGYEDDMFNQYQYQSNQDNGYCYGGLCKAEDGAEASEELINPDGYVPNYPFDQTRHEITFPGIETYLPFNMSELLDGTVDPATGNYINNLDESEEENVDEDETEVEENNIPANGDYYEGQTVDPTIDPSITQMKKGGNYKRNKKIYVNSILKLAKKAEGGEEKKSDNDPEAGDPTGAKIRKQKLNNFIGSLKKETEMFTLKEQAEKQYDQMMQQQQQPQNNIMRRGGPAGSRDPKVVRGNELRYRANQLKDFITGQNRRDREDNIDYFNVNDYPTSNFEEGDYNKDGYTDATDYAVKGQFIEKNNICIEDENGQTNCFPRRNENNNNEMHSYDHPSYSIDVRKSNWLTGKPSKYKIDFYGYSPLVDIANGNISGIVSNKPVVNSSNVSTVVSTINKSQSTDLQHGYFKTDANGDKIPDYLQPGPLSGLPTGVTSNLDVPVVVANTPQEIAKAKELESEKTKKIITNKQAKEIAEAKRQVELQKQILEAQRQVQLEQRRLNNQEQGGFVDSENPNLYEFNYGGYDPTQQDMDYSNSIDTTDPYFQRGGRVRKFIENFVPANILSNPNTYYNEVQRIYDPRTGKTIPMPSNMGKVSSINVDKSRFWSGKPKKYTINFNGSPDYTVTSPNQKDNKQKNNKQNNSQWSNIKGLNLGSKIAIRKGELGNKINNWKLKKQGLDEYGNRPGDEQGAIYNDGRLTKDREGNWYDRNNAVIPGKKRPSEVPGYYDNNQSNTNEPISNVEMLRKQGKVWDEKLNTWVDGNIPSKMPLLPVGQIDRKPTKIISEFSNNNQYNWPGYIDYNQDWIGNSQKLKEKEKESGSAWNDYINSPEDPANYGYMLDHKTGEIIKNPKGISQDERGLVWSGQYDNPDTSIDESMIWSNPASQEEYNADPEKYDWNDSYIVKNPDGTESSVQGYSGLTSSQFSPYKENDDLLFEESENADENYKQYVAEIPQHIRKKNYKELNKQIGFDLIQPDGSVSNRYKIGRKIEEIKKRNSPYRYAPKQVLKQYGGSLNKFLPKKVVGGPPPCGPGEMLDPATNKCKAVSGSGVLKNNPPNGAPGSPGTIDSWGGTRAEMNPDVPSFANPGASMKQMMGLDTDSMKSFTNPDGTPVGGNTDDPYSIDVKNKRTPLTFGKDNTAVSEARLNMFNAGVDIADSLRRGKESNKAENQMYENLSSNNLYASDPSRDRGDYDTNSGLYRPNEQGQMWNSRSKQFGGYIDEEEYYDPYVEEEDELTYAKGGEKITYMSEDQIRAFMAEGGQVEFL